MALDATAVPFVTDGTPWPDTLAINSSGPSATDGTEFTANMVNNWMWGRQQALLNYAGLTVNGSPESNTVSQELEAIRKGFAVGPGMGVTWWLDDDPSVTGHRVLMLAGQGILRSGVYSLLDDAVYVGDANNAAVAAGGGAFFHADNSDGSSPNTAGVYLILPDARGYALRGLDLAAAVDPDGAGRFLGDVQVDSAQIHSHYMNINAVDGSNTASDVKTYTGANGSGTGLSLSVTTEQSRISIGDQRTSVNDVTVRASTENRMTNISTNFGITY